jgi:hypothetical protein
MMRLPLFAFRAPRTLDEAARILQGEGPDAMPLAGGTDLLPNMKRRQQVPRTLLSLRNIDSLRAIPARDSAPASLFPALRPIRASATARLPWSKPRRKSPRRTFAIWPP